MKHRNGLLFPLMVLAAGSVTAFGCIGIAAITGYLPLARGGSNTVDYPPASVAIMERTTAARKQPEPMAVVAVDSGSSNTKAVLFQASKAVGMREPTLN